VNDNRPHFGKLFYATTLVDNPVSNLTVYQLVATDLDPGPLGKLEYRIVEGDQHKVFTIEKHTGMEKLNNLFNPLINFSAFLLFSITRVCKIPIIATSFSIELLL